MIIRCVVYTIIADVLYGFISIEVKKNQRKLNVFRVEDICELYSPDSETQRTFILLVVKMKL